MLKRTLENVILVIGIFLLIYQVVFFIREGVMVVRWVGAGRLPVRLDAEPAPDDPESAQWIISDVDSTAFSLGNQPQVGDRLLLATNEDGDTLQAGEFAETIQRPHQAYFLTLERNGHEFRVALTVKKRQLWNTVFTVIVELLRTLISFSFVLVGLWALYKRPDSGGVRALALFSFGMSAFMIQGVVAMPDYYALYEIPFDRFLRYPIVALMLSFGGFWLNLQLYFPRALLYVRRHPVLIHLLVYSPQIIAGGLALVAALTNLTLDTLPFWGIPILITIQTVLGFVILVMRRERTRTPLERRQLTLVLYGSGLGLGILGFLIVFSLLFPEVMAKLTGATMLFIVNIMFLALLLSPLSFAYAFGRYRLMEVEGRLRRGTRNILISSTLLMVIVLLVYGAGEMLLHSFSVESRTATMLVTLVLALGFIPAHRYSRDQVERRLYPERNRLKHLVNDFLRSTASMPDRATLWQRLEDQLRRAMGITMIVPIYRDDDSGSMVLSSHEAIPMPEFCELVRVLERTGRPLLVDEMLAAGKVDVDAETSLWLRKRNIALLLPMVVQSRLIGILGVCFEEGREDMAAEDLGLLSSLVTQVGLQSENLRLLEENFEKKRLEEQLAMARHVQERFLPRQLPDTPGLDVFARCIFSLEVAGDYYDVVSLAGGRTLMAVGDVSGKGAGAALIMANMQAALRTLSGIDIDLGEVVGRINDMIVRNTDPEQYITFFVAIFEPDTATLIYVNAGHNPPFVLHGSGERTLLETGGPVVGALEGLQYEQGRLKLQPGDLLIAYTDGVTEAMNEHEVEFGEERLEELLRGNRTAKLEDLVTTIQKRVEGFSGVRDQFADDFTLLLARAKSSLEV